MSDQTASREPELRTITEAAELLRAPVATLRYWRHLGTGPRSFRLGRRVVYRREDLYAWVDTQVHRSDASQGGAVMVPVALPLTPSHRSDLVPRPWQIVRSGIHSQDLAQPRR